MRRVYCIFAWLILLACFFIYLFLFASTGSYLLFHEPKSIDFLAFYTGAKLIAHSPNELYNLHSQQFVQQYLDSIIKNNNIFIPFFNPPFVAIALQLLLPFGLENAFIIFLAVNIFLLVLICFISVQQITSTKWYFTLLIVIGIATYIPVSITLITGQFNIILCLVLLLVWVFLKRGDEFKGGLLLSLLLIKPHFFILPFLAMLMQRRKKLLYGFITGIALLSGISYFFVGWDGINNYIHLLFTIYKTGAGYNIDLMTQQSIQTLLLIVFHTHSLAAIRIVWIIAVMCLILPTLFVWSKQFPFTSPQFSFQFALLIIATLLTSPRTHLYDISLLLVIVPLLLSHMDKLENKQKKIFILFLSLGYGSSLAVYRMNSLFHNQTEIWIVVSVVYLLLFWLMLVKETIVSYKA